MPRLVDGSRTAAKLTFIDFSFELQQQQPRWSLPTKGQASCSETIIRAPVKRVAKLRVNNILYLIDLCEGSRRTFFARLWSRCWYFKHRPPHAEENPSSSQAKRQMGFCLWLCTLQGTVKEAWSSPSPHPPWLEGSISLQPLILQGKEQSIILLRWNLWFRDSFQRSSWN